MQKRRANILILTGLLSFCILFSGLTYGVGIEIPCPFKALTGIPCPGCGGTRTFDALLLGDMRLALSINPLSVLLIGAVMLSILWLITDLLRGSDTLRHTLRKMNNRYVLWAALLLLLTNWARNILRGF